MTKVLVIPHPFRYEYFQGSLREAVAARGWKVAVVCQKGTRKAYQDVMGKDGRFYFLPNFIENSKKLSSEEEASITSLIERCEMTTGISSNRILLAEEREVGRAYSKEFYYWSHSGYGTKFLRNKDLTERFIERVFRFVSGMLEDFQPDFIVIGSTAPAVNFVTSLVAEERGIPLFINRRSKMHSHRCYWTNNRSMSNEMAKSLYRRKSAEGAPVSDMARKYIASFNVQPETIAYIETHWKTAAAGNEWWNWHRKCARMLLGQIAHRVKRHKGIPPRSAWAQLLEYYRMAYLRMRHSRMVTAFTESELKAMKYIYLPLHKEPELAINFQAYPWHSQKNTAKFLSSLLPKGYRLLVREHRGSWGRRPTAYYKFLNRLPGVVVIDPFDSQFKYVRNADLIVTENGSSGWEGLLMKRPVITLHENFYDAPGLTTFVTDLSDLNRRIVEQLRDPKPIDVADYEQRLGWFIDAQWETTFPDDDEHHADGFTFIETLLPGLSEGNASVAGRLGDEALPHQDDGIAQAL